MGTTAIANENSTSLRLGQGEVLHLGRDLSGRWLASDQLVQMRAVGDRSGPAFEIEGHLGCLPSVHASVWARES